MAAGRGPIARTNDQEFYSLILDELHEIRLLLQTMTNAVVGTSGSQATCPVCSRTFQHERALRAHMRVHDNEGGKL